MARPTRTEVVEAVEKLLARRADSDWDGYCAMLTEDAVYVEHGRGTFTGRDTIRDHLQHDGMRLPGAGWTHETAWTAVDGARAICRWVERSPRIGGREPIDVCGITVFEYAGEGRFRAQEDVYNAHEMERAIVAWVSAGGEI